MGAIEFRPLAEDDLVLLFRWLARAHVSKWYAPSPSSFAEVAAKYRPRTEEASVVKAYIVMSGGSDVGYVQAYSIDEFPEYEHSLRCEKGVVGIDLFIGDEWNTRHGLGARVIRRFVDEVAFGRYGAIACVAGPSEGDAGSIRAFEKAGFHIWKRVVNERGERECVMRRDREEAPFRIEAIDLIDADTCVRFRREMYVASFGTAEGLEEEMGEENRLYLEQLEAKLAQVPEGNAHLWQADRVLGQLEMRLLADEPHVGYVSLLYIVPEARGQGLGRLLHEHAAEVSRRRDRRVMRLSVSLANAGAIMFYRKLGWEVVGSRPNKAPMAIMEFELS